MSLKTRCDLAGCGSDTHKPSIRRLRQEDCDLKANRERVLCERDSVISILTKSDISNCTEEGKQKPGGQRAEQESVT